MPQFGDQRFYKYRPWNEYSENLIRNCEIYFANPSEINDPFDCRFPDLTPPTEEQLLDYMKLQYLNLRDPLRERNRAHGGALLLDAYIEAAIDAGQGEKPQWPAIVQIAKEMLLDRSSFCALTEVNNSSIMFAHYAAGHTGVCFEFHFTLHYALAHVEAVSYSETPSKVDVFNDVDHDDEDLVVAAMYSKHTDWAYEREWRAFDIRRPRGVVRFDPRCLSGIILGCRMAQEDRDRVSALVEKSAATPVVYEAVVSAESFDLHIRELT